MSDLPWIVRALLWQQRLTPLLITIFTAIVLRSEVNYLTLTNDSNAFFTFEFLSNGPDPFALFGVTVSIITLATLIPRRIVSLISPDTFICTVFFELLWLGVLQTMWIGTGAWSVVGYNQWTIYCQITSDVEDTVADTCLDVRLSAGFGFTIVVLLLIYYVPLTILACNAASKGKPVWWEGVSTTRFGYGQTGTLGESQWGASQATLQGGEESKNVNLDEDVKRARLV